MKEKVQFDISIWVFVKLLLVIFAFYLLFLIRDIVALIFIVLLLVATFLPIVKKWSKTIKRLPAVILLLLIIVAILTMVIYIIIPPISIQMNHLIRNAPDYINKMAVLSEYAPSFQESLSSIAGNAEKLTSGFVSITAGVFGGVITFLTAIVLFIYMLIDEKVLKNFVFSLIPPENKEQIAELLRKVANKVGSWFRGQVFLALIIGVIDLIGLLIIGVPYALTLAVVAAILEIVPTIGPIIAGVLAALIALSESPIKALIVALFFIAVQQLENAFIVPKIMQRAVGLSPAIIIIAVLIGAKLMGVAGAILAIPIAASISVLINEWPAVNKILNK